MCDDGLRLVGRPPKNIVCITAAIALIVGSWVMAADRPTDELCSQLFQRFTLRMTPSSTDRAAAAILLVNHGRPTGFWKEVVAEMRKGDPHKEPACVELLGRMLAADASARLYMHRVRVSEKDLLQMGFVAYLDESVVDELLTRVEKTEGRLFHAYVFALTCAVDERAVDLLTQALTQPEGMRSPPPVRFLAAVGLANLGRPEGIDWLIRHLDDSGHMESLNRPMGASSYNVGNCCAAALRQLTGENDAATRAEWEQWWSKARDDFQPAH